MSKNKRCFICNRVDKEGNMVIAVFTLGQMRKHGHKSCFADVNRELCESVSPYRWKIESNAPDQEPTSRREASG